MTDLFIQLSQLHDGDLSAEEARALRHRIATEPDVAQAWEELTSLTHQLDALPMALPAPPPVPLTPPAPANGRGWPSSVAGAVAMAGALAVALFVWARPPEPVVMALGSGVHAIDGTARVHVMGVQVDVDGRAALSVEPTGDLPRVGVAEDPMNALTHAAALATGAILTVTVYEGTAAVTQASGDAPQVVTPGTPLTVSTQGLSVTTVPIRDEPTVGTPTASDDVAALQLAVRALQEENDALRLQSAMASGQLALLQGEYREWPANPHPAHEPEAFTAAIEQALEGLPEASLLDIDCVEYPCIAHIDLPAGRPDDLARFVDPLAQALDPEEGGPGVQAMINERDNGDGAVTTLSVALSDEDAEPGVPDPRLDARVREFNEQQE